MSVHAMSWVFQHSKATGAARLVLLALADHAGLEDEECFPSVRRLAQWTQLTERGVQKAIGELRDAGRIDVMYGSGRNGTNCYRLRLEERTGGEAASGVNSVHPPPEQCSPDPGELNSPPPVNHVHPNHKRNHKELEPLVALTRSPQRGTRLPEDWEPASADLDWQRKEHIPDDLARRELPKFHDYWAAKAGKDATKIDWAATWRNWLRRAHEQTPNGVQKSNGRPAYELWNA